MAKKRVEGLRREDLKNKLMCWKLVCLEIGQSNDIKLGGFKLDNEVSWKHFL